MYVGWKDSIKIRMGAGIVAIKSFEGFEFYTERKTMKVSPLVFSLCMGCSKNNCFRIFTCKTWSNSILYAVGEKYIWFSKNGDVVDGNKKGKIYTLEQSLEYCKRKRDPWIELTTKEEVKNFLERSGYAH